MNLPPQELAGRVVGPRPASRGSQGSTSAPRSNHWVKSNMGACVTSVMPTETKPLFERLPLDIRLPAELFRKRFGGKWIAAPRPDESFSTPRAGQRWYFPIPFPKGCIGRETGNDHRQAASTD